MGEWRDLHSFHYTAVHLYKMPLIKWSSCMCMCVDCRSVGPGPLGTLYWFWYTNIHTFAINVWYTSNADKDQHKGVPFALTRMFHFYRICHPEYFCSHVFLQLLQLHCKLFVFYKLSKFMSAKLYQYIAVKVFVVNSNLNYNPFAIFIPFHS